MDPCRRREDGMRQRVTRHLVAAALVLLPVAAASAQQPAAPDKSPAVAAAGAAGDLSGVPLEHFRAIVERPLFSPARRPPSSAAGEPDSGARQFQLKGVVVSAREQHALIVSQSTGKSYRVRTGDVVEGWRVERITGDSAAFTKDGIETLVQLMPAAHP
jgi:general secretion pathway protein N